MKDSRLQDCLHAKTAFEPALWQWTRASLGPHRWVKASLKLQDTLRPESFLRLPPDWAFFWKSKELKTWEAAWGASQLVSFEDLLALDIDPELTIFGGFPFAKNPQVDADWQEFSAEHWFVPKFIWRQLDETAELDVYCLESHYQQDEDWQKRIILEAWDFYQKLRQASTIEVQSLPGYVERQDSPDRLRWHQMIDRAQQCMKRREFAKVVLSRKVDLQFRRALPVADLFRSLLNLNEESFLFACQSPSGLCFMGRSPERLLSWQNNEFQLDAIAGTRGRSSNFPGDQAFATDMQQSPKEQNEHRLVGQAITDMLKDEGIPFEQVDEEQIIRLQYVQHMRSRFKGIMPEGRRSVELLELLHPTPAVGGFPRAPALDFLLREESYQRAWFSGGIGKFQGHRGDVAIGIRSALVDGKKLHVYAGAGIVPGSLADAEWQEIEVKMQNFLGFLHAEDSFPARETFASDALSL